MNGNVGKEALQGDEKVCMYQMCMTEINLYKCTGSSGSVVLTYIGTAPFLRRF